MFNDKRFLHNRFLGELSETLYDPLLTVSHLNPFKIEIKKMNLPDGESNDEYNFRGWELIKDNVRYLIADGVKDGNPIEIKEILPVLPDMCIELGAKSLIYKHVLNPISMRKRKEQHYSFKGMIDLMSQLQSTNQNHQVLLNLFGFTSVATKFNCAICSNPGVGKDFTVDRHHAIEGNSGSISSPTLAKLEERSSQLKWLMVNEICNMSGADWRVAQGYLLDFGAHKEKVTRHSCGVGRGEIIDTKKLSITLAFNDITEYNQWDKKFFDFATDGNVVDRFPRFRLWGTYTEDFNALARGVSPKNYAEENLQSFKELMYTYEYYIDKLHYNPTEVLHGYDRTKIGKLLGRDGTNINKLLDVVDMYCDSQEEFNKWISILNLSMKDYRVMTSYPFAFEQLLVKMKIPKTIIEQAMSKFAISINKRQSSKVYDGVLTSWMKGKYMTQGEWKDKKWEHNFNYLNAIYSSNTFIEKDILIRNYVNPDNAKVKDTNIWG